MEAANIPGRMTASQRFWGAAALWLLGILAIGLVTVVSVTTLDPDTLSPEMRRLGKGALIAISLGTNGLLLTFAVAIGALTAHRSGLVSLIAHRNSDYVGRLKRFPIYLVSGIVLGLGIALLDAYLFKNIAALAELQDEIASRREEYASAYAASLVTRFAYGGIVEEILLRWCVLSGLAWLIFKAGAGRLVALWAAIGLSALLFGLGHLPAIFQMFPDVPPEMVIRTVALNAIPGLAYGIAYMRNSLEAAMVMHAATHIGLLASATTAV